MSINATEGNQSYPHDQSRTVIEAIESFVESTTDALAQSDASESAVSAVRESGEEVAQTVGATVARQSDAIQELEDKLAEERETRAKEDARDRQRLHEAETRIESVEEGGSGDKTPTPQAEETTIQKPETPLEDVIRVPEQVAEENLSANQQRARFVAKDIHEYSRSVPAGRVIKSSELRRVLSAKKEGRVYTETVSRVIEFLTKLGEESVKVRETQQGERVVVFTDGFVKRVVAYHNQHNTVVTERGATG